MLWGQGYGLESAQIHTSTHSDIRSQPLGHGLPSNFDALGRPTYAVCFLPAPRCPPVPTFGQSPNLHLIYADPVSTDALIYLFWRVRPALSLLLSSHKDLQLCADYCSHFVNVPHHPQHNCPNGNMDRNHFNTIGGSQHHTVWTLGSLPVSGTSNDVCIKVEETSSNPGCLALEYDISRTVALGLRHLRNSFDVKINVEAPIPTVLNPTYLSAHKHASLKDGNILEMERIRPIPAHLQYKYINLACSHLSDSTISRGLSYGEPNCLMHLYMGTDRTSHPAHFDPKHADIYRDETFVHSREFGCQFGQDTARSMGQALAFLHYCVQTDGLDVKFVLGDSRKPDDGRCGIWMFNFDTCGPMSRDEAGIEAAVEAYNQIRPYFPTPYNAPSTEPGAGGPEDSEARANFPLWRSFVMGYLITAQAILRIEYGVEMGYNAYHDLPLAFLRRLNEAYGLEVDDEDSKLAEELESVQLTEDPKVTVLRAEEGDEEGEDEWREDAMLTCLRSSLQGRLAFGRGGRTPRSRSPVSCAKTGHHGDAEGKNSSAKDSGWNDGDSNWQRKVREWLLGDFRHNAEGLGSDRDVECSGRDAEGSTDKPESRESGKRRPSGDVASPVQHEPCLNPDPECLVEAGFESDMEALKLKVESPETTSVPLKGEGKLRARAQIDVGSNDADVEH
jgi:hypothetical protein